MQLKQFIQDELKSIDFGYGDFDQGYERGKEDAYRNVLEQLESMENK